MDCQDHVSEQDLACLVEGTIGRQREQAVRAHVARCRRCLADYAEALRYRACLLDRPEGIRASDDLVSVGFRVTGKRTATALAARHWPRQRPALVATLGLSAAAVAVLIFALLPGRPPPVTGLVEADWAVLRSAAIGVSAAEMVLPGIYNDRGGEGTGYRSAPAVDGPRLESVIAVLARDLQAGRMTAESAYWLGVAYLATGRPQAARRTMRASLLRFPNDPRLTLLDAVIAYHESDFVHAEESLRCILATDPWDNSGLFNLGLLLTETGRTTEGRLLLERARDATVTPGLAERAEAILRRLP